MSFHNSAEPWRQSHVVNLPTTHVSSQLCKSPSEIISGDVRAPRKSFSSERSRPSHWDYILSAADLAATVTPPTPSRNVSKTSSTKSERRRSKSFSEEHTICLYPEASINPYDSPTLGTWANTRTMHSGTWTNTPRSVQSGSWQNIPLTPASATWSTPRGIPSKRNISTPLSISVNKDVPSAHPGSWSSLNPPSLTHSRNGSEDSDSPSSVCSTRSSHRHHSSTGSHSTAPSSPTSSTSAGYTPPSSPGPFMINGTETQYIWSHATLLYSVGEYQESLRTFHHLLKRSGLSVRFIPAIYINIGMIHSLLQDHYGAGQAFTTAVQLNPGGPASALATFLLGLAQFDSGWTSTAIECFDMCLGIFPPGVTSIDMRSMGLDFVLLKQDVVNNKRYCEEKLFVEARTPVLRTVWQLERVPSNLILESPSGELGEDEDGLKDANFDPRMQQYHQEQQHRLMIRLGDLQLNKPLPALPAAKGTDVKVRRRNKEKTVYSGMPAYRSQYFL